ncbi:MAG: SPOR domain-containing protein, partial [Pelomonas sp.]|nr:SPOR domain-containing protein [Roseateles sp.]
AKSASAPAAQAKAASAGNDADIFFVQVGAYTHSEDAEQQRARLALLGLSAKVMEKDQSGRTVYRVRVGPFDTREDAEAQQKKVQDAGMEASLVHLAR